MAIAYISIGSNLGDREKNCAHAIKLLKENGIVVKKQSSMHETKPWGVKDQPKFINMAIEVETDKKPEELLRVLKEIEKESGRKETIKWGPRVIDLDILFYDALILKTPDLEIPHPLLHEREFVLKPLCEIAPDKKHPVSGKTIGELYKEVKGINSFHIVLLPGMDGTGLLFKPLIDVLPNEIKTTVVSYPSDQPLLYKELLPIVLKALPLQEPFILLGESFSGPLALMAANQNRSNISAVILCASFIHNPVSWLPKWTSIFAKDFFFHFARQFIIAKALIAGYSTSSLLGLLQKTHAKVSPSVMAIRAREILSVNAADELKQCPVPVFYIGGENDRVVPLHNLQDIQRVREGVCAYLIPGPHLILQTKPKESARIIQEIAERVKII
jgi:2-amino-4-hydroxy-6-hydroxymethyldihydropteridine diphosphokinase